MKRKKIVKFAGCVMLSAIMLALTPLCAWGVPLTEIPSDTVTPVIPTVPILTVPAAPTELKATVGSDITIKLTWKDNSSNESGFVIQRKVTPGSDYEDVIHVSNANMTFWTDQLTTYFGIYDKIYYRVRAVNNIGDSGYSNEVSVTLTEPLPPTDLVLEYGYFSGETGIKITWVSSSPSLTDYFVVDRSVNSGAFETIGKTDKDFYVDTKLSSSTTYTYRIEAIGYYGAGVSKTVKFKTPEPAPAAEPATPVTEPAIDAGSEDNPDLSGDSPDLSGASDWAKPEIQKAYDLDLTTDAILNHYGRNITREEFCEIAVKLYEALSGKNALPAIANPFTDTNNIMVLKAFELGIVKGTSDTAFSPDNPITRQEICVMIYRTLKADDPKLNMDTSGVAAFSDEASIASWAIDAVKYANKNNIMKGTGGNSISPLNNTSREQAIVLLKRTYENFN